QEAVDGVVSVALGPAHGPGPVVAQRARRIAERSLLLLARGAVERHSGAAAVAALGEVLRVAAARAAVVGIAGRAPRAALREGQPALVVPGAARVVGADDAPVEV